MAADTSGNPFTFDGAGQTYTRDATATVGNANTLSTKHTIYVRTIDIHAAGAGGSYEVHDGEGRSLTGLIVLAANAKHSTAINGWVKGIVNTTHPEATGRVRVFHGPPSTR